MTLRATHTLRLLVVVVLLVCLMGPAGNALAQDGGVRPLQTPEEDGNTSPGDIIRQVITNIHRIMIPGQTMLEALNRVLAGAILGASGADTGAVFGRLASQVSNAINEIFRPEELVAVADATRPLAAGLAVPFFLLRLAIYHWRRLTGDQDGAVGVVGDWIVAAAWGFAAGQVVTIVLGLGVDLATQAFGSLPGLIGTILGQLAPPQLSLPQLVGMNFIGAIVTFATGLGVVAAAVGMLWAFAVASATAFLLAAVGPAIGVVGVVPQLRWLRSLWLKMLVVLGLFPLAIGAVFKAQALVIVPAGGGLLAGPVGSVVRLMWLWGAVGFLFTMAGMAGRFSLSTGVEIGTGVIRAGKAVLDLGLAAGAGLTTGGVGTLAAGGMGALGAAGGSGLGTLGAAGGSAGALGGLFGAAGGAVGTLGSPPGAAGGAVGTLGSPPGAAGGAVGALGTGSSSGPAIPGPGGNTVPTSSGAPSALASHLHAASALTSAAQAASQASGWSAVGMSRTAGVWQSRARQAELAARRHELNARIAQYLDDWGDDDVFGDGDDVTGPPPAAPPQDSVVGGTPPSPSGPPAPGGEISSPSGPAGIATSGGARAGTPPPPPVPPDEVLSADASGTVPHAGAPPATGAGGIMSPGGWPQRQVPPAVIRAYEQGVQERGGAQPSAAAGQQLFDDLVASGRQPAEIDLWFDGEPRQVGWLTAAYQQAGTDPSWPSLPPGERLRRAVHLAYSPLAPERLTSGDYPLYDALRDSLPEEGDGG